MRQLSQIIFHYNKKFHFHYRNTNMIKSTYNYIVIVATNILSSLHIFVIIKLMIKFKKYCMYILVNYFYIIYNVPTYTLFSLRYSISYRSRTLNSKSNRNNKLIFMNIKKQYFYFSISYLLYRYLNQNNTCEHNLFTSVDYTKPYHNLKIIL